MRDLGYQRTTSTWGDADAAIKLERETTLGTTCHSFANLYCKQSPRERKHEDHQANMPKHE